MPLADGFVGQGGDQGRIIGDKGDVGGGVAFREVGQSGQVDIVGQGTSLEVMGKHQPPCLMFRCRDLNEQVQSSFTQDRRVDHIHPVGRSDDEDAPFGAIVQLRQEFVDFFRPVPGGFAAAGRHERVKLVEAEHGGRLGGCFLKERRDFSLCAVDIGASQVRSIDNHVVETGFLGEFFSEIGLAAARRAIEQHPVGRREPVFLGFRLVAQHPDDPFRQHFLQFLHAGHVRKAAADTSSLQRLFEGCAICRCFQAVRRCLFPGIGGGCCFLLHVHGLACQHFQHPFRSRALRRVEPESGQDHVPEGRVRGMDGNRPDRNPFACLADSCLTVLIRIRRVDRQIPGNRSAQHRIEHRSDGKSVALGREDALESFRGGVQQIQVRQREGRVA